jgi:hypothetical protein
MRSRIYYAYGLFTVAQATFLAIGPPAAPEAKHMMSSLDFEEEIRKIEPLPASLPNNSTTIEHIGLWQNISGSTDSADAAATNYWWLVDQKFNHKVSFSSYTPVERIADIFSNLMPAATIKHFAMSKILGLQAKAKKMIGKQSCER